MSWRTVMRSHGFYFSKLRIFRGKLQCKFVVGFDNVFINYKKWRWSCFSDAIMMRIQVKLLNRESFNWTFKIIKKCESCIELV